MRGRPSVVGARVPLIAESVGWVTASRAVSMEKRDERRTQSWSGAVA